MKNTKTAGSFLGAMILALGLSACDKAPEADKAQKPSAEKSSEKPAEKPAEEKAAEKPEEKAAQAGEWKEYKLGDSGFAVMVAADPQCQEQEANGVKAKICAIETKETGMMSTTSKLPSVADPSKIAAALESAMSGSTAAMKGELVGATDITIGEAKGKDFTIKTPQGDIRSRLVIKGEYMVQVVAMAKDATSDTTKAESDKFVKGLSSAK